MTVTLCTRRIGVVLVSASIYLHTSYPPTSSDRKHRSRTTIVTNNGDSMVSIASSSCSSDAGDAASDSSGGSGSGSKKSN